MTDKIMDPSNLMPNVLLASRNQPKSGPILDPKMRDPKNHRNVRDSHLITDLEGTHFGDPMKKRDIW